MIIRKEGNYFLYRIISSTFELGSENSLGNISVCTLKYRKYSRSCCFVEEVENIARLNEGNLALGTFSVPCVSV